MSDTEYDPVAQALDEEIAALQSQVATLKQKLRVQATNIMTSESIHRLLLGLPSNSSIPHLPTALAPISETLAKHLSAQQAHDQQSLYRLCATITAFKVMDPAPNAVDSGKVFGLRFEVMVSARFIRPYFVLLNRPWSSQSKAWRIHKHTVPVSIPLSGIAARFLPAPKSSKYEDAANGDEQPIQDPQQDLVGFARALRREIWKYHNRIAAIADLRKEAGVSKAQIMQNLEDELAMDGRSATGILEIGASDAEAKHISLTWVDGRTGRIVVDDDGNVQQAAVFYNAEPDLVTSQKVMGNGGRVTKLEEIIERLKENNPEPMDESTFV